MGGDYKMWNGGDTPSLRARKVEMLRLAFGCGTFYPTMIQRYYRENYPDVYLAVCEEVETE
jgi:hypothetical protein